jgi:hypothetical protein
MDKSDITEAIEQAMENKMGAFFVEREQHYKDHTMIQRVGHDDIDFLIETRVLIATLKDAFLKTLIKFIVVASLSILTGGVYAYFKYHGKN